MSDKTASLTTRRGFITAMGFGACGLYALWAGYGVAPVPFLSKSEPAPDAGGGHGGHGDAPAMTPEEFERRADAFLAANRLPDGSVYPRLPGTGLPTTLPEPAAMDHSHGHDHGGHDHGAAVQMEAAPAAEGGMAEVWLKANRYAFDPDLLRLDLGQPYRFRMMALDVTHGASVAFGSGSHMARLRPGVLSESVLTFKRPGTFLVYCTAYCGPGHDLMRGRIVVG